MKVTILGATFNTPNLGVSMLAAGAIRCVLHRFSTASITLLDYAYEPHDFKFPHDGSFQLIRFVNIRFSKRFYLRNNIAFLLFLATLSKVIPSKRLRNRFLSRNPYLKELIDSDFVFAVSGGDSFSDIYGIARFFYVALPQLLALLVGRELICLPQTIGPFRSPLVRVIARQVLRQARFVYSRDRNGVNTTRELVGRHFDEARHRFCYDLAFDVDPQPPPQTIIDGLRDLDGLRASLVGLNVSGLLFDGGYTKDNMFGLKVDYQALISSLVAFLIEEQSAYVLLIPHVMSPPDTIESDIRACDTVYAALRHKYPGRIGKVLGNYNCTEIKSVIGQCSFFIGARMHACIAAISQGIPTVLIAYSDKFQGVMASIELECLVVDPRCMDEAEIIQAVERAYRTQEDIRAKLATLIPMVKQTIRTSLAEVSDPICAGR